MRNLIVLGAGGHGRVLFETAVGAGSWERVFCLDDVVDSEKAGAEILGTIGDLGTFDVGSHDVALGIGDNRVRLKLADRCDRMGFSMPAIVHPKSVISPSVTIGDGAVVFAGAIVSAGARLGRAVIINHGAIIDHDCWIGHGVHVSPGAALAGRVRVGDSSWIGLGACVRNDLVIGSNVLIGAGAAVVNDIPDNVIAMGVPARVQRSVE